MTVGPQAEPFLPIYEALVEDRRPLTTPTSAPPPPERQGVSISLEPDTPHPGDTVRLTVENYTRTRLEYGLAYRLERRVDRRWVWINRNAAFALILKIVEAGTRERENIRLPNDLRPGRHRIMKTFNAPATGRELDAYFEFAVANR
jgi:hypothetical protein